MVLDSPAGPIEARPTVASDGGSAACDVGAHSRTCRRSCSKRPSRCRSAVAPCPSMWHSAARSTPSPTPKRPACRSTAARLPDLRRAGMEIKREVERLRQVVHPLDAGLKGIYGTIFTAPPQHPDAHLTNVTIFADAEVDRSPCGTGTAAVMAVLSEMGVLGDERTVRAREHRRNTLHRPGRRPHADRRPRRPSSRRSKARHGSPASIRS